MSKQTQEARRRVHGLLVDEERLEPGISSLQFALDLDLDLAQQTLPRLGTGQGLLQDLGTVSHSPSR